ncbi:hypothetical protein SELMODRAFT_91405 [Selaginella moellendorffii]|uniref:NECAP PHear domain-containing protein n=1 Tax=Selaginella moellendorffii TaxID=88036 RepID=D8RE88_SELML|nr:hypothetical protein SELMODRAFT_124794 [Selaginella moellendorffii]EFJ29620.1 hypothetical protein SELMODRAFT_91405 [Selaginella moellendorffii]
MVEGEEEDVDPEATTLLVVREVSVYKIPPRTTSAGYKCGEWLQSDKIWSGRLRLVSTGGKCEVRLEDSNTGELFAACPVEAGKRDATVESVLDSSRYFVLKVDDGRGRHAFLGLGFSERSDAFDFNVALSDFDKHAARRGGGEQHSQHSPSDTSLDLRLKEGETIKINVKTRTAQSGGIKNATSSSMASTGRMAAPLAPPPGGGRIRSPLPPPPSPANDTKIKLHQSPALPPDPLADLSQLQVSVFALKL